MAQLVTSWARRSATYGERSRSGSLFIAPRHYLSDSHGHAGDDNVPKTATDACGLFGKPPDSVYSNMDSRPQLILSIQLILTIIVAALTVASCGIGRADYPVRGAWRRAALSRFPPNWRDNVQGLAERELANRSFKCRGWESNPHAPFGTQDFKLWVPLSERDPFANFLRKTGTHVGLSKTK